MNTKFQQLEINLLARILEIVSKNQILSKIHEKLQSSSENCDIELIF
jgi:hypothetical protein